MPQIRLTREFSFEAAHALDYYPGGCRNLHGHSYRLQVTIAGHVEECPSHYNEGVVMDFKTLNNIVQNEVIQHLDHCAILQEGGAHSKLLSVPDAGRILWVRFSPTCEAMLLYIISKLQLALPEGVRLHQATLFETATSSASWYADDQS